MESKEQETGGKPLAIAVHKSLLAVDIYRAAKRQGKYPTLDTDTELNSCFSIIILKQWDNIHHKKLI